jgi:hypothetical protein
MKLKISWVIIFIIFATVLFNLMVIMYLAIISFKNWLANYLEKRKSLKYEASLSEQGELNLRTFTQGAMRGKALNFHDASQMKDFIMPDEEIKVGEPVEGDSHVMHDYIPND